MHHNIDNNSPAKEARDEPTKLQPPEDEASDLVTLGSLLREARGSCFVGREELTADFDQLLEAAPGRVLFIHGPGGMGKTALLQHWNDHATSAGRATAYLDLAEVPVARHAVLSAVDSMGGSLTDGGVLFLDSFERHAPVEACYRTEALPNLPGSLKLVLAGRVAPSPEWRRDLGWRALMTTRSLGPLSRDESHAYLAAVGLSRDHALAIQELASGYPLGLALLAELSGQEPVFESSAQGEDMLNDAVMGVLDYCPSQAHREALLAASVPAWLDVALLEEMLQVVDASPLFAWLSRLSCVQVEGTRIALHDLFRDRVHRALRERWPRRYLHFCDRLGRYYCRVHTRSQRLPERLKAHANFVSAWRGTDPMRTAYEAQSHTAHYLDSLRQDEHDVLDAALRRFAPPDVVEWVPFWLEKQPQNMYVFRTRDGALASCLQVVEVDDVFEGRDSPDPLVAAVSRYVWSTLKLETSRKLLLVRCMADLEAGFKLTPASGECARLVGAIVTGTVDAALAVGFAPIAIPSELAHGYVAKGGLARLDEIDVHVGGEHYLAFGHNYELMPSHRWMLLGHTTLCDIAKRELGLVDGRLTNSPTWSMAAVTKAVSEAIAHFADDGMLSASELAVCLTPDDVQGSELVASALRARLRSLIDEVAGSESADDMCRVLHHACDKPGLKHTAAAAELGMSHRTYRRRRKLAVERVVQILRNKSLPEPRAQ